MCLAQWAQSQAPGMVQPHGASAPSAAATQPTRGQMRAHMATQPGFIGALVRKVAGSQMAANGQPTQGTLGPSPSYTGG